MGCHKHLPITGYYQELGVVWLNLYFEDSTLVKIAVNTSFIGTVEDKRIVEEFDFLNWLRVTQPDSSKATYNEALIPIATRVPARNLQRALKAHSQAISDSLNYRHELADWRATWERRGASLTLDMFYLLDTLNLGGFSAAQGSIANIMESPNHNSLLRLSPNRLLVLNIAEGVSFEDNNALYDDTIGFGIYSVLNDQYLTQYVGELADGFWLTNTEFIVFGTMVIDWKDYYVLVPGIWIGDLKTMKLLSGAGPLSTEFNTIPIY